MYIFQIMKLSKKVCCDALMPEKWKCFDNCPVCRLFKKAAEEGLEISGKELEEAFKAAEEQAID